MALIGRYWAGSITLPTRSCSPDPALPIPNPVAHLTFEHVKDFILIMVDVQGR
ncbi:hypothetical protein MAE02_67080 [Microvirga aerophila]|uniref:Uncharacterized protein n=1 Tax=Microvirga aerophila TaxID=670291 RepID=A0A512C474_9HYPH|nr:hypothetical protein [Microvirga aerophila]GEO19012.1 hypothetical protein MAE02_67080 [Microvirga aerophila]